MKTKRTPSSFFGAKAIPGLPVGRASGVRIGKQFIEIHLVDGMKIRYSLSWFPKLQKATPSQCSDWRLIGKGLGIHWASLDEDLSVGALLGL